MTNRERIIAALKGEKAEYIPLAAYESEIADKNAVMSLCKKGLCIIGYASLYKVRTPNVKTEIKCYVQDGAGWTMQIIKTPIGELYSTSKDGWVQEHYIKKPRDYTIMEYVIKDEIYEADYEEYYQVEKKYGQYGIVFLDDGRRSPYQRMMVDFAGVERFSYDIGDGLDEVLSLYKTMFKKQKETIEIQANGPGEIVCFNENITAETIGPARFRQFHLPFYEMAYPVVKQGGKLLSAHFDGRLNSIRKLMAKAKLDIIESFTPFPEGDMTYTEARGLWGDKAIWHNIPAMAYESHSTLRAFIEDVKSNTPGGVGFALEISEYLPVDSWYKDISYILELLNNDFTVKSHIPVKF